MKNISTFQLLVIGGCIFVAIVGVIVFGVLGGALGGNSSIGAVVIWGTQDAQTMQEVIANLRQNDKTFSDVQYVQKNPDTYGSDLINAIAAGNAPDLALLTQEEIASFANKLQVIPYSAINQSTYESTFIDEGNLFLQPSGILAVPFLVDPLMEYWNRDLYSGAGVAEPPVLWSDLITDAPNLTSLSGSADISKSAVALGGWSNIRNAKSILSALIMQAGDPIVEVQNDGSLLPVLGSNPNQSTEAPADAALRFYTDFADPSKTVYSWNRSLPEAQDAFAAGVLATYFGFASEYQTIAARNPNLHFGVAQLPQTQSGSGMTFGLLTGLAIPRGAKNPTGALAIAEKLAAQPGISAASQAFDLPPVRRDLIQNVPNDAVQAAFMRSALIARGWLDPSPSDTDTIFQQMVESVLSGQNTPADAVSSAAQAFMRLFPSAGAAQ